MNPVTDPELLRILNGEGAQAPQGGGPVYGPPATIDPVEQERLDISRRSEARQASTAERQLEIAERRLQHQIQKDGAKGPENVDPQKLANISSIVDQINRVQSLFNQTQKDNTIPGVGSLWEYLPTPANQQFNAASAGLAEQGLAAFRVPGVGSQSDAELAQFIQSNRPSNLSMDSANLERLRNLRNRVDATMSALGLPPATWEGVQDEEGLTGSVTYEGPNPANAAPQAAPAQQPVPEDIDAIMQKYGGGQ